MTDEQTRGEQMEGQDTVSARRWERPVIALALGFAVAGIIVGSTTGQSALAGGLIALAPVVVIAYQSVLTRLAVAIGQAEVDASLKQAAASLAQAEAAGNQVKVAELQLAALGRPVVVAGTEQTSHPVYPGEWTVYATPPRSDGALTAARIGVVIRNVGSGPAFLVRVLLGIENWPGVICEGASRAGGGVLPAQETVIVDFDIPDDRPEVRAIATILKSNDTGPDFPVSDHRLLVSIDYRDLSNRNQPRTILHLRNVGRNDWSVEAVEIQTLPL
jgi:hypothetical protein